MYYSLKRATFWNVVGYVYLVIAALISTPILVGYMGLYQFGQYSLILATSYLVSSIDFGLSQSVVRALSRDHKFSVRRQTLWATSSILFILTGLLAGVIAVVIVYNFHISSVLLPLIFCLCLISSVVAHYTTLPQAEGHFGYFNAKTFIVGTANTLLAAYLAWHGFGILRIITALILSYLLTMIVLGFFALKFFPHPRDGKPSLSVAKSLLSFGLKNQAGKIVGQAQAQYGKYLLTTLSPLILSAYVIAGGLVQKLVGGVVQVATAFYPASARSGYQKSTRQIYYRIQLGLFILGLAFIGLYQLFGLPFLTWWLGEAKLVASVHSFLLVYRYYGLLLLLAPMASTMLDGLGHPGITSIFATVAFAIELVVAIILLPQFGLLAPAYAGLVAIILTTPPLLYVTEKTMLKSTL